jgi:hypothetical protein
MSKTKVELKIGTRIYYGGDMANQPAFGTVIGVTKTNWGTNIQIQCDDGREKNVFETMFKPVYFGHGGTRFVTAQAYYDWKNESLKMMGFEGE